MWSLPLHKNRKVLMSHRNARLTFHGRLLLVARIQDAQPVSHVAMAASGWKAHGPKMGSTAAKKKAKIGFDYIHSIVDDHTRLAYSEIHDNEKGETCAGFFERAIEFYKGHGITIERFNRTVQTAWAYRQVYETNAARSAVLSDFLHRYNHQRRHHGLKNHPPISRLSPTS